jgi:hypothetical protein
LADLNTDGVPDAVSVGQRDSMWLSYSTGRTPRQHQLLRHLRLPQSVQRRLPVRCSPALVGLWTRWDPIGRLRAVPPHSSRPRLQFSVRRLPGRNLHVAFRIRARSSTRCGTNARNSPRKVDHARRLQPYSFS